MRFFSKKTIVWDSFFIGLLLFLGCKNEPKKPNVILFEKTISMIGTHHIENDSLQYSIFFTRLSDSILEYDLGISKNWRNNWLEVKGIVKFVRTKDTFGLVDFEIEPRNYTLYEFYEKTDSNEITIWLSGTNIFFECSACFSFEKQKRSIFCNDKLYFWAK